MIHFIWSVVVGFLVGLVARALLPGSDSMGFIATTIVGVLGSVVGGMIGNVLKKPAEGSKFHPAGFVMSIVGAFAVLIIWRMVR